MAKDKDVNMVEEAEDEEKSAKRKRGGFMKGGMAKGRPDRRARGGGLSDRNPYTAAGNVSSPDYLGKGGDPAGTKGKGGDKT